jgi:hypothetical protein
MIDCAVGNILPFHDRSGISSSADYALVAMQSAGQKKHMSESGRCLFKSQIDCMHRIGKAIATLVSRLHDEKETFSSHYI